MSNIKGKVQEIDIIGLLLLFWDKRKRILTNCAIAVVLAIVVVFSIPKEYTSTVVMAPEMSSKGGISSGLGAMASMVGVNLNGLTGSEDAFYPEIYPQIVSSTPFLMDIMKMQVESIDGEIKTNMYDYLCHHVKTPWWFKFYSVPLSFFKRLFTAEEDAGVVTSASSQSYNMKLSKKQFGALAKLEKSILVSVDKGNSVITINVTMQDPKITACVANEVAEKLKSVARSKQVLCVTHLPQLAAMGDTHLLIAKGEREGRTYTTVTPLDIEGRKRELARIIGGTNITETTLKSAEEMLRI